MEQPKPKQSKKKYEHSEKIKGKSWNEYQKTYCYIAKLKKESVEDLELKLKGYTERMDLIKKIIDEKIIDNSKKQEEQEELKLLKNLMSKYRINQSLETD
jgi:hypothetical protein